MTARIDLDGQRFGRLLVLRRAPDKGGRYAVTVRCDCGAEKDVAAAVLRNGNSTSCGCYRRDVAGKATITHGMSKSPEFNSWFSMMQRCSNPKAVGYKNYGGRGIGFDERWLAFENFFADMGRRPAGTSLDRIDNSVGYGPGNCRWATRNEQNRNRRSTRLSVEIARDIRARHAAGQSQTEIAKHYGVLFSTVNSVVHGRSWDLGEDASHP